MKTKLLIIFLAILAACGFNARPLGAVAPVAGMQIPLPNVNSDVLGVSVFLISNGYFWTVNDAQILLLMMESLPEGKKRTAAFADLKKYVAMGEEKYKAPTLLGNTIAALFGVFSIFPQSVEDYSDWYFYVGDLPGLPENMDAFERINSFVDAKVIDVDEKKMVVNRALGKDALRKALSMKKNLDKYPFPFFFKKKTSILPSFKTVGKTALGAAVVGSVGLGIKNFAEINAVVAAARTSELTHTQKRFEPLAEPLDGASVVLYRLRIAGQVVRSEDSVRCLFPAESPEFVYPNPFEKRDLTISRYSYRHDTERIDIQNGLMMAYLALNNSLDAYQTGVTYFDEMEYWEPEQLKKLVETIAQNPKLLEIRSGETTCGKRLFGDGWKSDLERDGQKFEMLLKFLIPSLESTAGAKGATTWMHDFLYTKNIYRATVDALGFQPDPDAGCDSIKRWAKFIRIEDKADLINENGIFIDDFVPAITHQELYQCICEMLVALQGETTLTVDEKSFLQAKSLSEKLKHEETCMALRGNSQDAVFALKDQRLALANEVCDIKPEMTGSLRHTLFGGLPVEWFFGTSFGPLQENLCPSEVENLQHKAIRVLRYQKRAPFPFFARKDAGVVGDAVVSQAGAGSSSDQPSFGVGAGAGHGRRGGAPVRQSLLECSLTNGAFPSWVYTPLSKNKKDYLPAFFGISFDAGTPLGLWLTRDFERTWYTVNAVRLLFQYEPADDSVTVWGWQYDRSDGGRNCWVGPLEGDLKICVDTSYTLAFDQYNKIDSVNALNLVEGMRVRLPEEPPASEGHRYDRYRLDDANYQEYLVDLKTFVKQSKRSVEYCDFRLFGHSFRDDSRYKQHKMHVHQVCTITKQGTLSSANQNEDVLQEIALMRAGGWYPHPYLRPYRGGHVSRSVGP